MNEPYHRHDWFYGVFSLFLFAMLFYSMVSYIDVQQVQLNNLEEKMTMLEKVKGKCKYCGAEIRWLENAYGRWQIVDVDPVISTGTEKNVFIEDGSMVKAVEPGQKIWQDHHVTCPNKPKKPSKPRTTKVEPIE